MADNLVSFLYDANQFAVTFREIIESSVAHIYLSALPSVHKTSKIADIFVPKYPSLAMITAEGIQPQQRPLLELCGHAKCVTSFGFSPDGTHIVSGSDDKTIRIWDARTGEEVMKPLKGHTDCIASVGFSPDGTHIVSGSYDRTIRIWDARTGEEVMKPLKGNISSVIPDIGLIASSSVLPNFQSHLYFGSLSHGDGWIRGSHQELLFWVIPEWRDFVQWHPCILIVGQSRVRCDLRHYVHGTEWTRCIANA
jgi:WD40 repeat protein